MAKKLKWNGSEEVLVKYAQKDSHGNDINAANYLTLDSVPLYQANTVIVQNSLVNISGKVLSAYTSTNITINNYPAIKILKNGSKLSESDAKAYMAAQTGSYFLPEYDYDNPKFTYFIFADGKIYKPQYDSTNGLLLYYMNTLAFSNDIQQIKTQGVSSIQMKIWTGNQAQYDSITTKDANTFYIIT